MAPSQEIPQHMKAQVLEAFNTPYAFKIDFPVPKLTSEHDVLVKVDAASYCHTDAVLAEGLFKPNPPSFPHIGSHETAGHVVALSDSPSEAAKALAIGTRVGVSGLAYKPCGTCFACKDPNDDYVGYSNYCSKFNNLGVSVNGGFCEYILTDARQLAPLPEGIAAVDVAPLMCAGVTIYEALLRCKLSAGARVAMVGCGGGLGHLGLQFSQAMGYRTLGIDAADGPLELAKSLGTDATLFDARKTKAEDVVEQLGKEDNKTDRVDMGVDAAIILPDSQASFDYGCKLLRNHGLCVVVSFPERGFHVSALDLVFRDIKVIGSLFGSMTTVKDMLAFASKHQIKAVKKTYSLEKLNELVDEYKKGGGGKLVVDMTL